MVSSKKILIKNYTKELSKHIPKNYPHKAKILKRIQQDLQIFEEQRKQDKECGGRANHAESVRRGMGRQNGQAKRRSSENGKKREAGTTKREKQAEKGSGGEGQNREIVWKKGLKRYGRRKTAARRTAQQGKGQSRRRTPAAHRRNVLY